MKKQKLALVLGGGSAYGFAHVGVIRALQEFGIKPDLIVGTSMGAIVGSYYAVKGEVESFSHIIEETTPLSLLADPGFFSFGIIKGKKIEKRLKEVFGNKKFKDCKTKLIINACDINTAENIVFKKGILRDAVRASMSIPGVFAPFVYKDRVLVDGGLVDNLPIDLVPEGYKIIAVKVTPKNNTVVLPLKDLNVKNPLKRTALYFNLLSKTFSIVLSRTERHSSSKKDDVILIHPSLDEFSYSSFKEYKKIVNTGYVSAKKALEKSRSLV